MGRRRDGALGLRSLLGHLQDFLPRHASDHVRVLVLDVALDVGNELVVTLAAEGLAAGAVDFLRHLGSFREGKASLGGIRPYEDGVHDLGYLVGRETGALRLLADLFDTGALVDAHRAERAVLFFDDVAADPADVIGHLVVADLARTFCCFLELGRSFPSGSSSYRVSVHTRHDARDARDLPSDSRDLDAEGVERLLRRFLLRSLLRRTLPGTELLAVDHRGAAEAAVVRRPLDLEHAVVDRLSAPGQRLLQLRLVIDVRRPRVLDAAGERLHDRLLDRLEAVLEEERGQRCLQQRREHVPVVREPVQLVVRNIPPALCEALTECELARDDRAARARDDVRADLGEPPFAEVGIPSYSSRAIASSSTLSPRNSRRS